MVQDVNKINDNYMECINIESVPKVEILNTDANIKKNRWENEDKDNTQ